MFSKFLTPFCALFIIVSISSCKHYSLSVNDNLVYTPPPLLKNFVIADTNLRHCVEQTIIDKHITSFEQFTQLNCSNAGISSLAGLEKFYAIEQLNLAENNLASLKELDGLNRITTLILRSNNLTDAEPLLHLLQLKTLDVTHNKNLRCDEVKQLFNNFKAGELNLLLPDHCLRKP
jgi:Leucine-rich repeat (LRR) protein